MPRGQYQTPYTQTRSAPTRGIRARGHSVEHARSLASGALYLVPCLQHLSGRRDRGTHDIPCNVTARMSTHWSVLPLQNVSLVYTQWQSHVWIQCCMHRSVACTADPHTDVRDSIYRNFANGATLDPRMTDFPPQQVILGSGHAHLLQLQRGACLWHSKTPVTRCMLGSPPVEAHPNQPLMKHAVFLF